MADLDPAKDHLHFDDATNKVNDVVVDYNNNYNDNRKLPATTPATLKTRVASELIKRMSRIRSGLA